MFSSLIMYHMYIYEAPGSYLLMEAHIFFTQTRHIGWCSLGLCATTECNYCFFYR